MAIGERVRAIFIENLNLKIASFFFALVLYGLVHGSSQEAQRSFLVDLEVLLPPASANRVLTSSIPPSVKLTLRGSRTALDELHADDIGNLQIDLHTGTEWRVRLDPSMVHVPPTVHVEQIDPSVIDLSWDDRVSRDVPIQVGVVGTPAPGFAVKSAPVVEPANVRVVGAKSEVLVLQHVHADAFDVTGLREGTYVRQLKIDKPQGHISLALDAVRVSLDITREIAERTFTRLPVAVVGVPRARTLPPEVDVRVACPPDVLRAVRPEQIVPRVDVKTSAPMGSLALPVEVSVERCEAHTTPPIVVVRW